MKLGDYVMIKGNFELTNDRSRNDNGRSTFHQGVLEEIGEDLKEKYIVISNVGKIRFSRIESFLILNFTEFKGKL